MVLIDDQNNDDDVKDILEKRVDNDNKDYDDNSNEVVNRPKLRKNKFE